MVGKRIDFFNKVSNISSNIKYHFIRSYFVERFELVLFKI